MAGKARIGTFSAPAGPYGGNLSVVHPSNNVVAVTAAQQLADAQAAAAQAATTTLFDQLKAAQQAAS
jgi:hypothetical protein